MPRGLIRSAEVRHAFLTVPRERFVPEHVAQRGLEAVYRDEVIVTLKDEHGAALSSSSQPGIMAQMLDAGRRRDGGGSCPAAAR